MSQTSENNRADPPSLSRQKTYIVDNASILDEDTRNAILALVIMEKGKDFLKVNTPRKEVGIPLDDIKNCDLVLQIYNMVLRRRSSLDEPAQG